MDVVVEVFMVCLADELDLERSPFSSPVPPLAAAAGATPLTPFPWANGEVLGKLWARLTVTCCGFRPEMPEAPIRVTALVDIPGLAAVILNKKLSIHDFSASN